MTFAPNPDDLAFALAQQRDDADLGAQILRDCLHIGADVGRALQQHAIVLTTERPFTGEQPRGADLTDSFDRYARAMRRTVAMLGKVNEDIVALCSPAPAPDPTPAPTQHPKRQAATRSKAPATERPDTERKPIETPDADRAETSHEPSDADRAERLTDADPAATIPDRPFADIIQDIKRDLALADPRHPDRAPEPESEPDAAAAPAVPWAYQRPPPEPPIPGVFTLDDLRRIPTGPSG